MKAKISPLLVTVVLLASSLGSDARNHIAPDGQTPAASIVFPALLTSPPPIRGVTCQTVEVAMRDNTLLSTDIYLPAKAGRYPVILLRTPYGGQTDHGCFSTPEVHYAKLGQQPYGYAVVYQLVRGTSVSQGSFNPFIQEINDEYDAVEWAAKQSWSTGRVGTTGDSYAGVAQWMGAIAAPPHLYAINPGLAGSDYHASAVYENGVFRLSDGLSYAADFVPDSIWRAGQENRLPPGEVNQQLATWYVQVRSNLAKWTAFLPLASITDFGPYQEARFIFNFAEHPQYDGFWQAQDTEVHYPSITVPALIGGASDDIFNIGTVRNYEGMRQFGGSARARTGTKLLWRAYGHAGDSGTPTFGTDSLPGFNAQLLFFDHYLKGISNAYESSPNARIFVMVPPNQGEIGSGFWIGASDFPLPGTTRYRLYFGSSGAANGPVKSPTSNGFVTPAQRGFGASSDDYVYDPARPVPTVGGNLLTRDTVTNTSGFQDQSSVETRPDVLSYTSPPLERDYAVIGTVQASFWAMTSAPDTDFTIKLVDVHADGRTHNIMDRVVAARFRLGSKNAPQPISPNTPYQYSLEVGNTATMFRQGHRVRIEISSSNFPKFARNLNTAQEFWAQGAPVVAHQTVLHSLQYPGFIELPVAPNVHIP